MKIIACLTAALVVWLFAGCATPQERQAAKLRKFEKYAFENPGEFEPFQLELISDYYRKKGKPELAKYYANAARYYSTGAGKYARMARAIAPMLPRPSYNVTNVNVAPYPRYSSGVAIPSGSIYIPPTRRYSRY